MLHLYLEPTVPHISLVFREMWDSTVVYRSVLRIARSTER